MCGKSNESTENLPPSNRYLIVVGGLLLVICVSLAALWMIERGRRIRAEQRIVKLDQQLRQILQLPGAPAQPQR